MAINRNTDRDSARARGPGALRAIAYAIALAVALLLAWYVYRLLLMVFAGILLGVFLSGLAGLLSKHTGLSHGWALAITILVLLAVTGGGIALLAPSVASQGAQLAEDLPAAYERLKSALEQSTAGRALIRYVSATASKPAGRLLDVAGTTLDTAVGIVVILFVGLYLAASPGHYRDGLVRLLPQDRRERAREVLDETGDVLWRWVMGRIILMVSNGLFTTIGLLIIGVPLPLVLGTIAGVLNFVPNIGPIVAAIPAILIALVQGPLTAVYVALLYLVLQTLDGYVFTPLVQQRAVSLPAALIIVFQIAMGTLAGTLGLLLATPIAAALLVLVKMLYLEDVLGQPVANQGERV